MVTMPVDVTADFKTRVKQAVADPRLAENVARATISLTLKRDQRYGELQGQQLRDETRQMKTYVLRHLPQLLEQFEQNVQMNGGQVHWAQDAAEANHIIGNLAEQKNVRKVVKSKSMATEEIHLNRHLEAAGVECVETDLGEYIIQLAEETPSHIVAPVLHKNVDDISRLFADKLDMPRTLDPQELCAKARSVLRQEFLSADMGISGCNFAIADTGTVCIVTNEGNGRLVSTLPRIYVAVMGIEKLVPTVQDAFLQYQALARSATGQKVTVYLSMTNGPRQPEDADGPEEFHVVLLDNGRAQMLEDGYGEALMCIRCGACLNVCPVYKQISGHAYGNTYSGPIGAVIAPLLAQNIEEVKELPYASTLCGACRDACPVQIDLPGMLLSLRQDLVEKKALPRIEKMGMQKFADVMQNPKSYSRFGGMAGAGSRAFSLLTGGSIRTLPPPLHHWTKSRDMPPFARRSFRQQLGHRRRTGDWG